MSECVQCQSKMKEVEDGFGVCMEAGCPNFALVQVLI